MTLLELCRIVRAAWDELFVSRYTKHLENENAWLRIRLSDAEMRLPAVIPAEVIARKQERNEKSPMMVKTAGNRSWEDIKVALHNRAWAEPEVTEEGSAQVPKEN